MDRVNEMDGNTSDDEEYQKFEMLNLASKEFIDSIQQNKEKH